MRRLITSFGISIQFPIILWLSGLDIFTRTGYAGLAYAIFVVLFGMVYLDPQWRYIK